MSVTLYTVSDDRLAALKAGVADGHIYPVHGIRWATLQAMAHHDWVTLHPAEGYARITRRGAAMIRIGDQERERATDRRARSATASTRIRGCDPFALIASAHTHPSHLH